MVVQDIKKNKRHCVSLRFIYERKTVLYSTVFTIPFSKNILEFERNSLDQECIRELPYCSFGTPGDVFLASRVPGTFSQ
jgi:hypothetical protein